MSIGILAVFALAAAACGNSSNTVAPSPSGSVASPSVGTAPLLGDPDRTFLTILDAVPGFVGYWFDPETNTYHVNSRDPNLNLEDVKGALVRLDAERPEQIEDAEFQLNHTPFGLTDLNEWYDQVSDIIYEDLPANLRPCLGVLDLDRFRERVWVALTCEEARVWVVQRVLDEIDAPLGAIVITLQELEADD